MFKYDQTQNDFRSWLSVFFEKKDRCELTGYSFIGLIPEWNLPYGKMMEDCIWDSASNMELQKNEKLIER